MLIDSDSKFQAAMDHIEKVDRAVADTETTGLDIMRDVVAGIAVRCEGFSGYFPFNHQEGFNFSEEKLWALGDLIHSKPVIVGHNYKYDMQMLYGMGVELPAWGKVRCTSMRGHLLNENDLDKLEHRAKKYGLGDDAEEGVLIDHLQKRFGIGGRGEAKGYMHMIDASLVAPYAENDVLLTDKLDVFYEPFLERYGLAELAKEVDEYSQAIAIMEMNGFGLDLAHVESEMRESTEKRDHALAKVREIAGYKINPNSPQQVVAWLGTADSTKETLEAIELAHPGDERVRWLQEFRRQDKATGTYYKAFLEKVGPDGRLHPSLKANGTVSGRPTCSRPNLLAVPRETDTYHVRSSFVAEAGKQLAEIDLSQAEMRLGAHYGNVDSMRQAFIEGRDIHANTAADLGVSRQIAKAVNFSVIYGIGHKAFSRKYHVPLAEAKQHLDSFHSRYPGFRSFARSMQAEAGTAGFIRMWTGRRRCYDKVRAWPKDAANNKIQGGVSEIIRRTITWATKEFPSVKLVLTVYDSIIVEGTSDELKRAVPAIKRHLEDQPWCTVPLKADVKIGTRWGQLKEAA